MNRTAATTQDEHQRSRQAMTWFSKVRLRAMAVAIGIPIALFGIFSLHVGWVTLPLVGVAVAMTVSKLGSRFDTHTCLSCGHDLSHEDAGVHGVLCPKCGALSQHGPRESA